MNTLEDSITHNLNVTVPEGTYIEVDDGPRILDSGARRKFGSGAVRDIVSGKGRCDLMPIDIISNLMPDKKRRTLADIGNYIYSDDKDVDYLYDAIRSFLADEGMDICTALLEVAKHYEEGCNKYGERNWEKGIPIHCYIDSGIRHLIKYYRGDDDEPHMRAFIWNMLGAIWTSKHIP